MRYFWIAIFGLITTIALYVISTEIYFAVPVDDQSLGEFIGGLTTPIIGLISAILIYLAFDQQRKANEKANNIIQIQEVRYLLEEIKKLLDCKDWIKLSKHINGFVDMDVPNTEYKTPEAFNDKIWKHLRSRLQLFRLTLSTIASLSDLNARRQYLVLLKQNCGILITNSDKLVDCPRFAEVGSERARNMIKELSTSYKMKTTIAGING